MLSHNHENSSNVPTHYTRRQSLQLALLLAGAVVLPACAASSEQEQDTPTTPQPPPTQPASPSPIPELATDPPLLSATATNPERVTQATTTPSRQFDFFNPAPGRTFPVQSVDTMKLTKDRLNNLPTNDEVQRWLDTVVEVGATHISLDQPIDHPENAVADAYRWAEFARLRGLAIFHRHMSSPYEGIYGFEGRKDPALNYAQLFAAYIINNPDLFQPGDVIGNPPEPHGAGIRGTTHCSFDQCIYPDNSTFNQKLREIHQSTTDALSQIGVSGQILTGIHGFDGFYIAGLNNPDWQGKSQLETATLETIGNIISLDHYPENAAQTMATDLVAIQSVWPQAALFISEWGTTKGESVKDMRDVFEAFRTAGVIGVNYWHLGPDGKEALVNADFSKNPNFSELQAWFTGQR